MDTVWTTPVLSDYYPTMEYEKVKNLTPDFRAFQAIICEFSVKMSPDQVCSTDWNNYIYPCIFFNQYRS
ncbi:hypothetical protein D3C87_85020 [compost metagenome]